MFMNVVREKGSFIIRRRIKSLYGPPNDGNTTQHYLLTYLMQSLALNAQCTA